MGCVRLADETRVEGSEAETEVGLKESSPMSKARAQPVQLLPRLLRFAILAWHKTIQEFGELLGRTGRKSLLARIAEAQRRSGDATELRTPG